LTKGYGLRLNDYPHCSSALLEKMVWSGDMGHRCVQGHQSPFDETAGTRRTPGRRDPTPGGPPAYPSSVPGAGAAHDPLDREAEPAVQPFRGGLDIGSHINAGG
jgi:hypothetical protein